VSLHNHLDDLRLQLELSTSRAEALAAVKRFTETAAAKQLGPRGQDLLVAILGKRIAALPGDC
jgi:hypothetical protein